MGLGLQFCGLLRVPILVRLPAKKEKVSYLPYFGV